MMKNPCVIVLVFMFFFNVTQGLAHAQDASWPDLNRRLAHLYSQGHIDEALTLAQEALRIAESKYDEESPEVALALNNLALFYKLEGNYDKALGLYEKSLAIAEKIVGVDHQDLVIILNNLAFLYKAKGDQEKVNRIKARLREVGHLEAAKNMSVVLSRAIYGRVLGVNLDTGTVRIRQRGYEERAAKEVIIRVLHETRLIGIPDLSDMNTGDRIFAELKKNEATGLWEAVSIELVERSESSLSYIQDI